MNEQEEILAIHEYNLHTLAKPYDKAYIAQAIQDAALGTTPFNADTDLSTGQPRTALGYLDQMLMVFGEGTPPVDKARDLLDEYGPAYVPPGTEDSVSYLLGHAYLEEEYGYVPPAPPLVILPS